MKSLIQKILLEAQDRDTFWTRIINALSIKKLVEVGVYKGEFALTLLMNCKEIDEYIAVDPWRNLDNWNKPANQEDSVFNSMYIMVLNKLGAYSDKAHILRGTTLEVVHEVDDEYCDFIYIDADHTLRGISIDLINWWGKLKTNGLLCGDDFSPSIYQHGTSFEPTFVYPFAIHFAEAVQCSIYKLPFNQFLIHKDLNGFNEIDLSGNRYPDSSIKYLIENKKRKTIFRSILAKIKKN